VNDEQRDSLLAQPSDAMPAGLSDKIRAQIRTDVRPVKLLAEPWVYVLVFSALFAVIGTAFAAKFRFVGWHAQSPQQALFFLTSLCALALAGGVLVARALRPGSGSLHGGILCVLSLAAYEALVLALYRNYSTAEFVHLGVICLALGVLCGALTAIPIWFVVRRGFVVYPALTGALIGLLGGLTGLLALTLLCPLLTTPHAGVWHAAVLPVCVTCGSLTGRWLVRH
jgi:hypothetical protein